MTVVCAIAIRLLQVRLLWINKIEQLGPFTGQIDYEQELSHLENGLYHLEKKMNMLLEIYPTIGEESDGDWEDLESEEKRPKRHRRRHHHHRRRGSSVEPVAYSDYETSEFFDY